LGVWPGRQARLSGTAVPPQDRSAV
jgi:hypothetical protein